MKKSGQEIISVCHIHQMTNSPLDGEFPVLHSGPSVVPLGQTLYSTTAVSSSDVFFKEVTSSKLRVASEPLTALASACRFLTSGPGWWLIERLNINMYI